MILGVTNFYCYFPCDISRNSPVDQPTILFPWYFRTECPGNLSTGLSLSGTSCSLGTSLLRHHPALKLLGQFSGLSVLIVTSLVGSSNTTLWNYCPNLEQLNKKGLKSKHKITQKQRAQLKGASKQVKF